MNEQNKLGVWYVNSTFSLALIYLGVLAFEAREGGAYADTVFALMCAFVVIQADRRISGVWFSVCVATVFAMSAAATAEAGITLFVTTVFSVAGVIAVFATLVALICTWWFSFVIAREWRLKTIFVYSGFFAQAVVLYLVFRYGHWILQRITSP